MSSHDRRFAEVLQAMSDAARRRALRVADPAEPGWVVRDGARLLNVSANDYLGLSRHPALAERGAEWGARHGTGAGASRLVSGTLDLHRRVEARMAAFKRFEAALLFASGRQADASVLPALFKAPSGSPPPASGRSASVTMISTISRHCWHPRPAGPACASS